MQHCKKRTLGSAIGLANRFSVLAVDLPVNAAPVQTLPNLDSSVDLPPLAADRVPLNFSPAATPHVAPTHHAPSQSKHRKSDKQSGKSLARRKIFKEAFQRRSRYGSGPVTVPNPELAHAAVSGGAMAARRHGTEGDLAVYCLVMASANRGKIALLANM